jgi:hypothetical protein
MKGWDSNANKRNRGNQHYRTSELLLRIQILFFFFFFFSFFYVFSLFFSEAQSRNTNKFQHIGIYLYKMKNTHFKLMLNFRLWWQRIMDFFVWCSVVVLVYCTNKIEELKDRIIRRKHKIEWQHQVFLWC